MPDIRRTVAERASLRDELIARFPELSDDDQALADTLDGISDLKEQVAAILRAALEREAMADGMDKLFEQQKARQARLTAGAGSLRSLALWAMQEAGLTKITASDMTIGVGAGRPKVVIVDEERIPADLKRVRTEPNRSEIAKRFAAGESVPGCELGNAQPFLQIHRR